MSTITNMAVVRNYEVMSDKFNALDISFTKVISSPNNNNNNNNNKQNSNHRVQNGSGAHAASYPMGTRGSFLGDKAAGA
jgi:hypothetical protein